MKPAPTTETILTSPKGFGLSTATPLQRAICRMKDGLPLGELANHPTVITAFGGEDAVAALPVGTRPKELLILAAIRTFKSLFAAAAIVEMSQSIDTSGLGAGDTVRIPIWSLKMNLKAVLNHLTGTLDARPLLQALRVGDPKEMSVALRHPGGREIDVPQVPMDRAGTSVVSDYLGGAVADEAPRMIGAEDGVKNWDDMRTAAMGRMLPGAQIISIGSPWGPFGPIYDMVQEFWGKPSADLVVVRGTGPALNPYWWTPERCADLERRNPSAYRTDVLGEFADPESSLFGASELERVTRDGHAELLPAIGCRYVCAIDPGTRGNSWPLVIMHSERLAKGGYRYVVDLARQWTGRKGAPLSPDAVFGEIAAILQRYGLPIIHTDQWAADALKDIARRRGLTLRDTTITAEKRLEMYESLRTFVASGTIELPPVGWLRSDLLSVRKRVTAAGYQIVLPHSSDGRHADGAAALALCASHAMTGISDYVPPKPYVDTSSIAHQVGLIAGGGYVPVVDRIDAFGKVRQASPRGGGIGNGFRGF